nr:immunoglobulin light chain junction region [Macaca mulatta]MPO04003.1 immunoglobulin light chain junction region [Macaca mulatta]MPO06197.1 immunoglobulin light chain junction region [Macaca mulatta]MPO07503.1 immunoglobulin light chain junction region [Macaca mulatta]MPO09655.1 immunoglobulin light chain junction region [Macaca mulatta]
CNSYAHSNVLF